MTQNPGGDRNLLLSPAGFAAKLLQYRMNL